MGTKVSRKHDWLICKHCHGIGKTDLNLSRRANVMLGIGGRMGLRDICYADIAEIRTVFSERRHNLWLEFVRHNKQSSEKLKEIQERMYSSMNEMTPMGKCNRILEACQDVEDEIQAALQA